MNTKQKIGRACMIVGILLILGALALLGYNQWDANRADKASQDALGKLEETLTETIEDKTKDEEPVVQPELDPEQEMTVTDIDGWGYIGYLSVPSIGLELPVMSEWSYAGLKVAPGRYSGSTYADNMVVCAHNYAKHFSPIKWLALGSEVYFTDMDGQRWSYEVSNVETIQPTDIDKMITASDEDAWDLTLFTCTTGGRSAITPEKVAINLMDGRIADNAGYQPIDVTIQEDGETAYFTSLPVKAMVQNIKDAGIPSALSYTAGSYVCNYLMYTLLYLIDRKYPNIRGGFIHVPYAMEQVVNKPLGTPSMDLHQIARGLEKAVEAVVKNDADLAVDMGTTH